MKKVIYSLAAVALVAGIATSCNKQDDEVANEPFKFDVVELTDGSATVAVTPDSLGKTYFTLYGTKDEYNTIIDSLGEAGFIEYQYEYVISYIAYLAKLGYNRDFSYFATVGKDTLALGPGLDPQTEYVAAAFYLDSLGNNDGKIYIHNFTTKAIEQSNVELKIASDGDTLFHITLSDENQLYIYYAELADTIAVYGAETYLQNYVDMIVENRPSNYQFIVHSGNEDVSIDELAAWNAGKYQLIAAPFTEGAHICGKAVSYDFEYAGASYSPALAPAEKVLNHDKIHRFRK